MQPQLQAIADDLQAASARVARLRTSLPGDRWQARNEPARWSVAECVEHLNLSSAGMLPPIEAAVEEARQLPRTTRRLRRDPVGWLLGKFVGPEYARRMPTTPSMMPARELDPERVVADFERWQARTHEVLAQCDGYPVDRLKLISPFNARVRYNIYAGLLILSRHQHRHLQQAERVWATPT